MYPETIYFFEGAGERTGFASMETLSAAYFQVVDSFPGPVQVSYEAAGAYCLWQAPTIAHHYRDNLYFVGNPFLGEFYRLTEEVAENGMVAGALAPVPAYRLEKLAPSAYPADALSAQSMVLVRSYMNPATGSVDTGEGWIADAIDAYERGDETWHEGDLTTLMPVVENIPGSPEFDPNSGEWREMTIAEIFEITE